MRAIEAQPSQRFIHSAPPLPPSKHHLLTETGDLRVQLIILGSLTWQNPPFNEIRSRVLRQEDSLQGQKIGLVSTHFLLQLCILSCFSKENALNHNHKAACAQTVIMKRTCFKIYCAFHPIMSHKRPTSCSNTTEAATLHSFPQHNNTLYSFLLQIPTKLGYVWFYRHVLNICIAPLLPRFRQCEWINA